MDDIGYNTQKRRLGKVRQRRTENEHLYRKVGQFLTPHHRKTFFIRGPWSGAAMINSFFTKVVYMAGYGF